MPPLSRSHHQPAGGLENMVLLGKGFQILDYGISRDPNGLYGAREVFGQAGFPPNPLKDDPQTFPNFGKLEEGPPGPHVDLLWAVCGPVSYATPNQPAEVAAMLS